MYRLVKLSPVVFFIFIMSGIIAVIAAYAPNYEKKLYKKTSNDTTIVGYPAGDNIPIVTSVEDINQYDIFTVYIKGENIEETGIYEWNYHKSNGYYTFGKSRILREVTRFFDNIGDDSFSEYCILTLENGEKIIAYLDINLLDIQEDEYIMLPIGEVYYFTGTNLIADIQKRSEVSDENAKWFVDMSGTEWRKNELGNIVSKKRNNTLGITFILSFITITFILYKYAEKKLSDELE